jgi:iron complex outermembrane recepter protein
MVAALVALPIANCAIAQETRDETPARGSEAAASVTLEEIVVTGTHRITPLQTTPIAVSAISADMFEQSFSRDIRGVADMIPSLQVTTTPAYAGAAAIGIRGTGSNDIVVTIDSSIGVVADGMVLPSVQGQLLDPFDVEQVEVMRGPQGTLFGKNTTGGVILIRSQRPILDEFSGKAEFLAGSFGTREVRAAVNVPLVDSVLAFRAVVTQEKNDGYYTNDKISTVYGTPSRPETPLGLSVNGDGRDLGGRDALYAKAKFLLSPNDTYNALLTFEYGEDNSPVTPVVNETPANGLDSFGVQREFLLNTLGFPGIRQTCARLTQDCILSTGVTFRNDGLKMDQGQRVDVSSVYLNQEFTYDPGTLSLFTGYRTQTERLPGSFGGEAWPTIFDSNRSAERDLGQVELRFASALEGPLQYTAGAAYFINNIDFRHFQYIGFINVPIDLGGCDIVDPSNTPDNCFVIGPGSNDRATYQDVEQDGKALGLYTEVSYEVTDAIRLVAGGRYSKEDKDFDRRSGAVLTDDEVGTFSRTDGSDALSRQLPDDRFFLNFHDNHSWDGYTFKAGVDWKLNRENFVYFTFNQGFKSGSYVETCGSPTGCAPFDEETADSWEIGYKGEWFDRRVRFNADVYYTTIDNVVRSQSVPIINQFGEPDQETQFRNIAGQKNYGVEFETVWQATSALQVMLSGSWLKAEYTSLLTDVNSGASIAAADRPQCYDVDALGNDDGKCIGIVPPFAPELKFFAGANYTMDLAHEAQLVWHADVSYQDEYETSLFNSDDTQYEDRTLVNLNLTYAHEKYSAAVFVRNLTNETYRVIGNSVAGLFNLTRYGEPRVYGAQLTVKF